MDFTTDFYFRQSWHDPRLSFAASPDIENLYVGAEVAEKIWVPDTFFANEKSAYFHLATTPNKFLRISHTGSVFQSIRLTVTAACAMDLQYFPMDSQLCALEIESCESQIFEEKCLSPLDTLDPVSGTLPDVTCFPESHSLFLSYSLFLREKHNHISIFFSYDPLLLSCCQTDGYSMSDIIYRWAKAKAVSLQETLSLPQFQVAGHLQEEKIEALTTGEFCVCVSSVDAPFSLREQPSKRLTNSGPEKEGKERQSGVKKKDTLSLQSSSSRITDT